MRRRHDQSLHGFIRRYRFRWTSHRLGSLAALIAAALAYSTLVLTAFGYEPLAPIKHFVGFPAAGIVLAGVFLLVTRKWTFVSFLDYEIDRLRRKEEKRILAKAQ
jgi:hypothetical protein